MSSSSPVVVRVTSRRAPAIVWMCASCHQRRLFDCSGRLRANTNGKLVDIWLIYRCRVCDATKNITVVERTPVRRVPQPLLAAAQTNDALVARRLARDVALLKRSGATVGEGDDWYVDRTAHGLVALEFDEPLLVRLDAVLATVYDIPRCRVAHLVTVDASLRIDALRLWDSCVVRTR